jgi:hypothetical protein
MVEANVSCVWQYIIGDLGLFFNVVWGRTSAKEMCKVKTMTRY